MTAISGVVTARGRNLGGAAVDLYSGTATLASTRSDPSGRFRFGGLDPGSYTIRAQKGLQVLGGAVELRRRPQRASLRRLPDRGGRSWPAALELDPLGRWRTARAYLYRQGQACWFKFKVEPQSLVRVSLDELAADFDLCLYKDIEAAYKELLAADDLKLIQGSLAPDEFSPDEFSPDEFSPDEFSPDEFSPDEFSPDEFSPDEFSPDAFDPLGYNAAKPLDQAFPAGAAARLGASPAAFSSAQQRCLVGVSARPGTSPEEIVRHTWANDGHYYARVRGKQGAFSVAQPFRLRVRVETGKCREVHAIKKPHTLPPQEGVFKTIILHNLGRERKTGKGVVPGSPGQITSLRKRLNDFAARPEVAGVLIDVSKDDRVKAAAQQAENKESCPQAKNMLTDAIKDLVIQQRAKDPARESLEQVLIIGGDEVIPYFRHPDQAGLGNERRYIPPVREDSASEASLRSGYVLSQDAYGSVATVDRFDHRFPLPGLAVGRLAETAAEITGMLDAYLHTPDGAVQLANPALVAGCDFMASGATQIAQKLTGFLGKPARRLISPPGGPPWTADDLEQQLLARRHDVIFLGCHFSAVSAVAADYRTRLLARDFAMLKVDLENSLVISQGCHSGYTIVDDDDVPSVTQEPDFPQAFARHRATLIAGTGYQYGHSDFIEYGLRLYNLLVDRLAGDGAVSIGAALRDAKVAYLASKPALNGTDVKTLLQATLLGIPNLRLTAPRTSQLRRPVAATEAAATAPDMDTDQPPGPAAKQLELASTRLDFAPKLRKSTVPADKLSTAVRGAAARTAAGNRLTYYEGAAGTAVHPSGLVLPLERQRVAGPAGAAILRGVGLKSASYRDEPGRRPLAGLPVTEMTRPPDEVPSRVLFPVRFWQANWLAAAAGTVSEVSATPVQFISASPGSADGRLRRFTDLELRLFYSGNLVSYGNNRPGLALPPSVAEVRAVSTPDGRAVELTARVVGDPSAGVVEVWATYTYESGAGGRWASIDLVQGRPSTDWTGRLDLGGHPASQLRFMVQAANGVGLVALAVNGGDYYRVEPASAAKLRTRLTLSRHPRAGLGYGDTLTVSARLQAGGRPRPDELITFSLAGVRRLAVTDRAGMATVSIPLKARPARQQLIAALAETDALLPSSAAIPLEIQPRKTQIEFRRLRAGDASGLIEAVLSEAGPAGRPMPERTLIFRIGTDPPRTAITDFEGRAVLPPLPLHAGQHRVRANFGPTLSADRRTRLGREDPSYQPSAASTSITVRVHP